VSLHQSEAEGAMTYPLRWSPPEMITEQTLSLPMDRRVRIPTLLKDMMTQTRTSDDKDHRSQRRGPLNIPTKRPRAKLYRAKGCRIV
jgi:hypothetical protein